MRPSIIEVDINRVIPRKEKRLVNTKKPLQSGEPLLVKEKHGKYEIINGHHRYFKSLEMGRKKIKIIIREKW